jgi:hypothetical protein
LIEWINVKSDDNLFFEEFLIIEKGLYPELIPYLSNKFSSFLKFIQKAKRIQELKLVKYGVKDKLNASMTKFVLTNHHGYVVKKEVDETVTNKLPTREERDQFLKELKLDLKDDK